MLAILEQWHELKEEGRDNETWRQRLLRTGNSSTRAPTQPTPDTRTFLVRVQTNHNSGDGTRIWVWNSNDCWRQRKRLSGGNANSLSVGRWNRFVVRLGRSKGVKADKDTVAQTCCHISTGSGGSPVGYWSCNAFTPCAAGSENGEPWLRRPRGSVSRVQWISSARRTEAKEFSCD